MAGRRLSTLEPNNLSENQRVELLTQWVKYAYSITIKYARKFSVASNKILMEDLHQESLTGLWKATRHWKSEKGNFPSYAHSWCKAYVIQHILRTSFGDVLPPCERENLFNPSRRAEYLYLNLSTGSSPGSLGISRYEQSDRLDLSEYVQQESSHMKLEKLEIRNHIQQAITEAIQELESLNKRYGSANESLPKRLALFQARLTSEDLSDNDLAKQLGVSRQAIGQTMRRLRKHIKIKLEEKGITP